jgi:peroxiredoxin
LQEGDRFPDLTLETSGGTVRLSERWAERPLIVAFMRHFGCAFCREQLILLTRSWNEIQAAGGDAVAIFQYGAEATERFCNARGVPFACLGDPALVAYDRVALGRWRMREVLGLRTLRGWRRTAKVGAYVGIPNGDVGLRPATFVVARDGRVAYAHYNGDLTDNPPVDDLLAALGAAA